MPAAASSVAVLTHTVVTTSTVAGCDLNANDPQLSVILNSSVTVDPPPLPPASAIAPEESELSIHVHIDAGTTCTGPLIVTASVYSLELTRRTATAAQSRAPLPRWPGMTASPTEVSTGTVVGNR